jgi:hypothetical protein
MPLNSDSTNRNRIRGWCRVVTRQWTGMPQGHSDATSVDPANAERNHHDLPWEVSLLSGRSGLSTWQQAETGGEKSAEAIVTPPSAELAEALQGRKTESTDRPSRQRRVKG